MRQAKVRKRDVWDLYGDGESSTKISELLGCSVSRVSQILRELRNHNALEFERLTMRRERSKTQHKIVAHTVREFDTPKGDYDLEELRRVSRVILMRLMCSADEKTAVAAVMAVSRLGADYMVEAGPSDEEQEEEVAKAIDLVQARLLTLAEGSK